MNYMRGPSYLLAFTLVIGAAGQSEAVASSEPQITAIALAKTRLEASTLGWMVPPLDRGKYTVRRHQCHGCWDI